MKTKVAAIVPVSRERADPTLPFTPITIDGREYKMCFDLGALAEAEDRIRAKGYDVNLCALLPELTLSSIRVVFAASLYRFHPEIEYEDALKLVTYGSLMQIGAAVVDTWTKSIPEAAKGTVADPPEPVL